MLSPMMTVFVLAVLWLIVVVPMIIQRFDRLKGERSVVRFGGAMRALATRTSLGALARPVNRDEAFDGARPSRKSRPEVFVPGRPASAPPAARRPVPAAMEAVMYPERIDKADLSDARWQMMKRRRRALTTLILGTFLGLLWAVAGGGRLSMVVGLGFILSLASYLYFLRSQALKDRARRENRLRGTSTAHSASYDLTEAISDYTENSASVRIDDEDVALLGIAETIDLTGLYVEEEYDERAMRRAV